MRMPTAAAAAAVSTTNVVLARFHALRTKKLIEIRSTTRAIAHPLLDSIEHPTVDLNVIVT